MLHHRPPCAICLVQEDNPDIITHKCRRCSQVEICRRCLIKYEDTRYRGQCPVCRLTTNKDVTWYEEKDIEEGVLEEDSKRVFITESSLHTFARRGLSFAVGFIVTCVGLYFIGLAHSDTITSGNSFSLIMLRIILGLLLVALYVLLALCMFVIGLSVLVICTRWYNECMYLNRI